MELYQKILTEVLSGGRVQVVFPDFQIDPAKIVEQKCYQALEKIKAILENDSLDNQACFVQIEKIVSQLELLGSNAGSRHDF